jgi:alanine racemase
MAHITISRENFYHNLQTIINKTGSIEKVAIVLKDNAYGHGLLLMATMASAYGITHAVVRNQEEAVVIEALFPYILVLGNSKTYSHHTYAINSIDAINDIPKGTKVALKVDTGMHRNGIAMEELEEALERIEAGELQLVELMTHYRSADELSSEFFWQKKRFERVKAFCKEKGFEKLVTHSYNSASLLRTQSFSEDRVRVGLALYGYSELSVSFGAMRLKPLLRLYASKVSSRLIKEGARVGYGGDFVAPSQMRVSTYDIGYGDGLRRATDTIADGSPLLGRVSMDFIAVASDEQRLLIMDDATALARAWGTITYEVLTGLCSSISREIV